MKKKYNIDPNELKNYLLKNSKKDAANYFGISFYAIVQRMREYGINVPDLRISSYPVLSERQCNIINGCLLGDATIQKNVNRKNTYFKFGQAPIRRGYVEWLHNCMMPFSKKIKEEKASRKHNGKDGGVLCSTGRVFFYTTALPIFRELRKKWYEDSLKIVPKDLILNWETVSYWFADDGTNSISQKGLVLCTNGFRVKDVELLSEKLQYHLGIESNLNFKKCDGYEKSYPILRISNFYYNDFLNGISSYLNDIKCLKYKIKKYENRPMGEIEYTSRKLSSEQVEKIVDFYFLNELKVQEIADLFKVSISTIERCVYRKGNVHRRNKIPIRSNHANNC